MTCPNLPSKLHSRIGIWTEVLPVIVQKYICVHHTGVHHSSLDLAWISAFRKQRAPRKSIKGKVKACNWRGEISKIYPLLFKEILAKSKPLLHTESYQRYPFCLLSRISDRGFFHKLVPDLLIWYDGIWTWDLLPTKYVLYHSILSIFSLSKSGSVLCSSPIMCQAIFCSNNKFLKNSDEVVQKWKIRD